MEKIICLLIMLLAIIPYSKSQEQTNLVRTIPIPIDLNRFSKMDGTTYIPVDRTKSVRDKVPPKYVLLNLKGKVKTIKETDFVGFEKFGEFEIQEIRTYSIYQFNASGKMLERCDYDIDNSLIRKCSYILNNQSNPLKCISTNLDGSLRAEYTYNYDDSGNSVEENSYDLNKVLLEKLKNSYDENNRLQTRLVYSPSGALYSKSVYEYDKNGNCTETYSDKSLYGTLHVKSVKKTNDRNLLTKVIETYYGHPKIMTIYTYDDKNNLSQENSYILGYNKITAKYDYDIIYEYEYDNFGNWISKRKYKCEPEKDFKEQVGLKTRKLEYYE